VQCADESNGRLERRKVVLLKADGNFENGDRTAIKQ
jgi:hypothetical protein